MANASVVLKRILSIIATSLDLSVLKLLHALSFPPPDLCLGVFNIWIMKLITLE